MLKALDKKFAELTIKEDSIVRDLKLNRRLLYRNLKLFKDVVIDLMLISMVTLLTTLLGWVIVVISASLWVVFMVSQSMLYCHTKENTALSVENKAHCSTLWKIEHTFPSELVWYHTLMIYRTL